MKKLVFRIRRRYFDAIVNGTKAVEYRRFSYFWTVRLVGRIWAKTEDIPVAVRVDCKGEFEGVFISGRRVHRREVLAWERILTPKTFSEQGKKDVDTPTCLAISLGESRDLSLCLATGDNQ